MQGPPSSEPTAHHLVLPSQQCHKVPSVQGRVVAKRARLPGFESWLCPCWPGDLGQWISQHGAICYNEFLQNLSGLIPKKFIFCSCPIRSHGLPSTGWFGGSWPGSWHLVVLLQRALMDLLHLANQSAKTGWEIPEQLQFWHSSFCPHTIGHN